MALNLKLSQSDFPEYKEVMEEIRHAGKDSGSRRNILIQEASTIESWEEDVTNLVKACVLTRIFTPYREENLQSSANWRVAFCTDWLDILEDSSTFSKLFWTLCEVANMLIRYQKMKGVSITKRQAFAEVYEVTGQEAFALAVLQKDPLENR